MVPCLDQNTGVNTSELLSDTMSSYCVVPCLDQNTGVNVSELFCGTMSRPEYWC